MTRKTRKYEMTKHKRHKMTKRWGYRQNIKKDINNNTEISELSWRTKIGNTLHSCNVAVYQIARVLCTMYCSFLLPLFFVPFFLALKLQIQSCSCRCGIVFWCSHDWNANLSFKRADWHRKGSEATNSREIQYIWTLKSISSIWSLFLLLPSNNKHFLKQSVFKTLIYLGIKCYLKHLLCWSHSATCLQLRLMHPWRIC